MLIQYKCKVCDNSVDTIYRQGMWQFVYIIYK